MLLAVCVKSQTTAATKHAWPALCALQVLSSGADGLLKLWDTRTGANLATFESHDNRLWGLAVSNGPDESLVASGGDDSSVVVWRDVTADKAAAAEAEEAELVMKQQELSNALAVSTQGIGWCAKSDQAVCMVPVHVFCGAL